MKKIEIIIKNVNSDKELMGRINKESYSDVNYFVAHANRYIKAIKEGRVINSIGSVSKSGMSRTLKFLECSKNGKGYSYYNFYLLFRLLGFTKVNDSDFFRVYGCGMDMIFDTNYRIIHTLHRCGILNNKECASLAQMTPPVI